MQLRFVKQYITSETIDNTKEIFDDIFGIIMITIL